MKNIFIVIILLFSSSLLGQKHSETIKKELSFPSNNVENTLTVNNIHGDVTVEGYNGNKILVEVEKTIEGKTQAKLEQGKSDIELGIQEEDNLILIYNKTPCSDVQYKKTKEGDWQWRTWKNDCRWGNGIHFRFDIKIKVPYATNLEVATVNDGKVVVKTVAGEVKANNVNGSIALEKISGKTNAHTINGDVDITYAKNPGKDSRYYSLNGDINAFFQKGLSAQLSFESYNGDFFTNIEDIQMLPSSVEKKKKSNGIKYKIGGKSKMQVGGGKVLLDFETFNGNVYVKEM